MKKWGNAYPIKCLPRWQNRGNFQRMVMGEYKYIPKEEKRNLNVYNKEEGDNMTKKEWEACNTCWTCKHRQVTNNKVVTHREPVTHIFCGHEIKVLTNRDIINSPDCPHREKEDWRRD